MGFPIREPGIHGPRAVPRWRGACSCAAALLLLGSSSSAATTPALPVDLGRKTNKSTAAEGLGGRVQFVGSGEEAATMGVALDLTTALLRALLATPESRRQQQQEEQAEATAYDDMTQTARTARAPLVWRSMAAELLDDGRLVQLLAPLMLRRSLEACARSCAEISQHCRQVRAPPARRIPCT